MKRFSKNFWTVIGMEFTERGSYYGVMSILSAYLVLNKGEGGLEFTKQSVGIIKSTITPLLYILPIISGALADRYGYRKILFFSFIVMSLGYFFVGLSTSYPFVFSSLLIMAIGAGFFKPIISGTIAHETNSENSSIGFGIYYWSINLGAFLFPLILVPYLKEKSYPLIFFTASFLTGSLLFLNLFVFKEPEKPKSTKSFSKILEEIVLVLVDWRFVLMIGIYSLFWICYFQMFDTMLWYVKERMDMSAVNHAVNKILSYFISNPNWHFDVEHITVVNAGAIIILQLLISVIVKNFKALPTIIGGVLIGSFGLLLIAITQNPWFLIMGLVVFSIGEMCAHPKFISYIGEIAPAEKKALYLGYSSLYGVIGSFFAGILGSSLYELIITKGNNPTLFWLVFVVIGVICAIGLYLFDKKIKEKKI
jgi:proton-dependent oligopeptide transporter, POT family